MAYQTVNPANNQLIKEYPPHTDADIERAKRMASRIETGMVYINWLTDTAAELPFGGVKRSGFGRELSDLGIKEFVNQKLVVVRR